MEEWRDIPGSPDYQASSEGRVRSLDRMVEYAASRKSAAYSMLRKGCVLKAAPNTHGYLTVVLGRGNTRSVHELVTLAFHGPKPEHCRDVRHLNHDKLNNTPANLQWGTRGENLRDDYRDGRRPANVEHARTMVLARY